MSTGAERPHEGEEHDRGGGDVDGDCRDEVGGVGSGGHEVKGRDPEQTEAGEVDRLPPASGHAAHQQGGDLHADQEVQRYHAERDRPRLPCGREGNEDISETEVRVVVGDQAPDVQCREDDGSSSEEAMQVGEPRRGRAAAGQPRAEEQAPDDGRSEQPPRDEPSGPREEPPQLRVHVLGSWIAAVSCRVSSSRARG